MSSLPASALSFVLAREGVDLARGDIGYSNNPNDPGKATAYGITQATYDAYRKSVGQETRPVKEIEYPEVAFIYERDYWSAASCDQFNDQRPRLALCHFDCAVNNGTGQAAFCLQRAVGVVVDGQIGPKTIAAAQGCDEDAAVSAYLIDRARVYRLIVTRRPASQEFLPGWLARLRWVARETGVPIDSSYAQE